MGWTLSNDNFVYILKHFLIYFSTVQYSAVQFDLVHLECYIIAWEVVPSRMVLVYIKRVVYKYITSCVEPAYFVSPLGTLYQAKVLLIRHSC